MRSKIVVCAESFGFGPASKGTAIVRALEGSGKFRCSVLSESLSHEFFAREGLAQKAVHYDDSAALRTALQGACAAIVIMDPRWVRSVSPYVPVAVVDSLGFLWHEEFFSIHPETRDVGLYMAQDVFDSAARLRALGVRNVKPVGALTQTYGVQYDPSDLLVVQLGGLMNPYGSESANTYLKLVGQLYRAVAEQYGGLRVLGSASSRNIGASTVLPLETSSHREAVGLFAAARTVLTSPGLTTLLELSRIGVPTLPLPPQNPSQVAIIHQIVDRFEAQVSPLWRFLRDRYAMPKGLHEKEGVRLVQEMNLRYGESREFAIQYRKLATQDSTAKPVPTALSPGDHGLDELVFAVSEFAKGARRC